MSNPPSSDRKERQDRSKPGGAKPGHEGHSRSLSEDVDRVVDHHPDECPCCRSAFSSGVAQQRCIPEFRDPIAEVERLADLHARGSLSDVEFEVMKAQALSRPATLERRVAVVLVLLVVVVTVVSAAVNMRA